VTRSRSGRITSITRDGGPVWSTFAYDPAGRLVTATGSSHDYTYDYTTTLAGCAFPAAGANSNRGRVLDHGAVTTSVCYDAADRIVAIDGAATGTYDAHGNTVDLAGTQWGYDITNRHLTQTTGTTRIEYTRDATDRITERRVYASRVVTSASQSARLAWVDGGHTSGRPVGELATVRRTLLAVGAPTRRVLTVLSVVRGV